MPRAGERKECVKKDVKRRCRHVKASGKVCNKPLPVTRYFHCEICVRPEADYGETAGTVRFKREARTYG